MKAVFESKYGRTDVEAERRRRCGGGSRLEAAWQAATPAASQLEDDTRRACGLPAWGGLATNVYLIGSPWRLPATGRVQLYGKKIQAVRWPKAPPCRIVIVLNERKMRHVPRAR